MAQRAGERGPEQALSPALSGSPCLFSAALARIAAPRREQHKRSQSLQRLWLKGYIGLGTLSRFFLCRIGSCIPTAQRSVRPAPAVSTFAIP
jgi:hypothetical protein